MLQVRRAQRPHEAAGLGQVVLGGLTGPAHMGGGRCVRREGVLGGPQQQLDAGQALREGVVDLAGQPLPLRQRARGTLRLGQLRPCGHQLLDELTTPLALAEQRVVAEYGRDGDRRPEQRADERARGDRLVVEHEAGDGGGGGDHHGGQPPSHRQQVQLQEVQREGHPEGIRRQDEQGQPHGAQRHEPDPGGPGVRLHGRGQGARAVQRGHQPGQDDDLGAARRAERGECQQSDQQGVQTEPQRGGDGGVRTRIHGPSSVEARGARPVNRRIDVSAVPRAMSARGRGPSLESCSSHGEIFGSQRAVSRSWARSWC